MDYRNYSFSKEMFNRNIKCEGQRPSKQLYQDYDVLVFLCARRIAFRHSLGLQIC